MLHPDIPAKNPFVVYFPDRRDRTSFLTSVALDLGCGTLGSLLGNLGGLSTGGTGSRLGLLCLLLALGLGLLLLALLDGGGTGGLAGLGADGALLLDHVKGETNDGTLGLDGAAGALLGDLLWWGSAIDARRGRLIRWLTDLRDTLLVLATEQNSPGDPAGVLALEEQRLGLSVEETEDLGVTADEDLTPTGVNLATCSSTFRQIKPV